MSYKRKENYRASMLGIAVSFGLVGLIVLIQLMTWIYEAI
jgi:hypothetical protein